MSNQILPSAGYVFLNQRSRQLEQAFSCGQKFQRVGDVKMNEHVKSAFYHWILRRPQIVQYLIANDCLKIIIYGQTIPQLVTKFLLKV